MKALIVFYSRTGNTRKAAEVIAAACGGDLEEVVEVGGRRTGVIGWLRAGRDAMKKKRVAIEAPRKAADDYDVVFVGSPVWGWTLAPAIRSYLEAADIGSRPIALFCTMGGSGDSGTFAAMRDLVPSAKVVGELAVTKQELGDAAALRARAAAWVNEVNSAVRAIGSRAA
jgi:flavodoxin